MRKPDNTLTTVGLWTQIEVSMENSPLNLDSWHGYAFHPAFLELASHEPHRRSSSPQRTRAQKRSEVGLTFPTPNYVVSSLSLIRCVKYRCEQRAEFNRQQVFISSQPGDVAPTKKIEIIFYFHARRGYGLLESPPAYIDCVPHFNFLGFFRNMARFLEMIEAYDRA